MPSLRLLPRSQKTELQNLKGRLFPGGINRFSQLASSQAQTQTRWPGHRSSDTPIHSTWDTHGTLTGPTQNAPAALNPPGTHSQNPEPKPQPGPLHLQQKLGCGGHTAQGVKACLDLPDVHKATLGCRIDREQLGWVAAAFSPAGTPGTVTPPLSQ